MTISVLKHLGAVIFLAVSAVITLPAFAAGVEPQSEFFFRPPDEKSSFSLGVRYAKFSVPMMQNGTQVGDLTITQSPFFAEFQDSVNADLSFGFNVDYGNDTQVLHVFGQDQTYQYQGIGDIHLFVNAATVLKRMILHYGIDVGLSPGNAQIPDLQNVGSRNSGGATITPYVGFRGRLSDHGAAGLKVSYTHAFERTLTNQATVDKIEEKNNGGDSYAITPFAEWDYGHGFYGASLSYSGVSDAATTIPTQPGSFTKYPSYVTISVTPYASLVFNSTVSAILSVSYNNISGKLWYVGYDRANVDSFLGSLSLRLIF